MNDNQLERSLQSIGKKCFVKYFDAFNNQQLSNEDVIEMLMKNEGYEESGCRTRVTQARRIIKAKMIKSALTNISQSSKIEVSIIEKAKSLLNNI
jgi:hypothetical protein